MQDVFPPDTTLDDIKIAIKQSINNPNIGAIYHCDIKDGPRTFKIATIFEIIDPHTGEIHHYSLRLDSFRKLKSRWEYSEERTISLDSESGEIEALVRFIRSVTETNRPDHSGEYHIVDEETYLSTHSISEIVQQSDSSTRNELLRNVIAQISAADEIPDDLHEVFQSGSIPFLNSISVSARLEHYRRELTDFRQSVESGSSQESHFQDMLERNAWLFGSEYSELLDRRNWTRDDRLDFMLRRTTDGFLEIVEIKTPSTGSLFRYDQSHDSYYPSSDLSKAVGQVMRYIAELERNRDTIIANDGYDPLKVRARIITGRDGDERQQQALYAYNAHLNQIEVLTFDQLVSIGERVLSVFLDELMDDYSSVDTGVSGTTESTDSNEVNDLIGYDEDNIPF